MRLSFRGFLAKYCKELTSSDTTSLKKLFELADTEYPRAYEPLLLLAICDQRQDYLLKQAQSSSILHVYIAFLSDWKNSGLELEEYLLAREDGDRFKRPLIAWRAQCDRIASDRKVLVGVSRALNELLEAKKMTRAQACKSLNINKGNFYAFLKGDTSKLSRKTAMRIYRQLSAA